MSYDCVKKEICPQCGNDTFKNNFLLKTGENARVFVECASCGHFVARYILRAYVDPDYDFSSTMWMIRSSTSEDSIRGVLNDLKGHQQRARTQFSEVQERINCPEKEKLSADESSKKIMDIIREQNITLE